MSSARLERALLNWSGCRNLFVSVAKRRAPMSIVWLPLSKRLAAYRYGLKGLFLSVSPPVRVGSGSPYGRYAYDVLAFPVGSHSSEKLSCTLYAYVSGVLACPAGVTASAVRCP